jgi:hypothetical protein
LLIYTRIQDRALIISEEDLKKMVSTPSQTAVVIPIKSGVILALNLGLHGLLSCPLLENINMQNHFAKIL